MGADPDEEYLSWLYSQVAPPRMRAKHRRFDLLFDQMLHTDFVWLIYNDDNRAFDGRELREEFCRELNLRIDPEWMRQTCSVFEMIFALARRMTFDAGGIPHDWFWVMLDNLGLKGCHDTWYATTINGEEIVDEALSRMIWRNYESNGEGGLFPLQNPRRDQREVEIWYQMNAYILEHL